MQATAATPPTDDGGVSVLLDACLNVQRQISTIKNFIFEFCESIERAQNNDDQKKSSSAIGNGEDNYKHVTECITRADGMTGIIESIIDSLHTKTSAKADFKKTLNSFKTQLSRLQVGRRNFLKDCVVAVSILTKLIDDASDVCNKVLEKQKYEIEIQKRQIVRQEKEDITFQSHQQHFMVPSSIVDNFKYDPEMFASTREALEQYGLCTGHDDDYVPASGSSASASGSSASGSSASSSLVSCKTDISIHEFMDLVDDSRAFLQMSGSRDKLEAAKFMLEDSNQDEIRYKRNLILKAIEDFERFNNMSRRETYRISQRCEIWLRSYERRESLQAKQQKKNQRQQRQQQRRQQPPQMGQDDDTDPDYEESDEDDDVDDFVNATIEPDESNGIVLDNSLIPSCRVAVNVGLAWDRDQSRKVALSEVFATNLKMPSFHGAVNTEFLKILNRLVDEGIVFDDTKTPIKPLRLISTDEGIELSESFMNAKALKATTCHVELIWLYEYLQRLAADGMHDGQRVDDAAPPDVAADDKVTKTPCFWQLFTKVNKECAQIMKARTKQKTGKPDSYFDNVFYEILQNPGSNFEARALEAIERQVLEVSKPPSSVIEITEEGFQSEFKGRWCLDNASTLPVESWGAKKIGHVSSLFDGGATKSAQDWLFGTRNVRYCTPESEELILILHMCEIVTLKNKIYSWSFCIEITEITKKSSPKRYKTIHSLPLCDEDGRWDVFAPITLSKVRVIWDRVIEDLENGLLKKNPLKIFGLNVLKAIGDEFQNMDAVQCIINSNGGLLPYYLNTESSDNGYNEYNEFVEKFNKKLLAGVERSSSNNRKELNDLYRKYAIIVDNQNGTKFVNFILDMQQNMMIASNDRFAHCGTGHFYLGINGRRTELGCLQHTTKFENNWKSALKCCGGRVIKTNSDGILTVLAKDLKPVYVTPKSHIQCEQLREVDSSSVTESMNSSASWHSNVSVDLSLYMALRYCYAQAHLFKIAKKSLPSAKKPKIRQEERRQPPLELIDEEDVEPTPLTQSELERLYENELHPLNLVLHAVTIQQRGASQARIAAPSESPARIGVPTTDDESSQVSVSSFGIEARFDPILFTPKQEKKLIGRRINPSSILSAQPEEKTQPLTEMEHFLKYVAENEEEPESKLFTIISGGLNMLSTSDLSASPQSIACHILDLMYGNKQLTTREYKKYKIQILKYIEKFNDLERGGSSTRTRRRRKLARNHRRTQYTNKHKRSSKVTKRATIKHRKSYRKHNRTVKRRKSRRHH